LDSVTKLLKRRQSKFRRLNPGPEDVSKVDAIVREVQGAFAHIEDRTWLAWGSEILPVLRSKVEEEEEAAAAEEEEVRQRLEVEKAAREAEERLEAAQHAERVRREDAAYEDFEKERITLEEYTAALKAIENEFATAATDSQTTTDLSKDTESEVSSITGTKAASKRKAVIGKEGGASNAIRVRSPSFNLSPKLLTLLLPIQCDYCVMTNAKECLTEEGEDKCRKCVISHQGCYFGGISRSGKVRKPRPGPKAKAVATKEVEGTSTGRGTRGAGVPKKSKPLRTSKHWYLY
jgi:hypothetical protein